MYRLRGCPVFDEALGVLEQYDGCLREQFERILGDSLSDAQWTQASFRPSEAGCGIRRTVDVAGAAFLGGRGLPISWGVRGVSFIPAMVD